jgi:hypothetical protein
LHTFTLATLKAMSQELENCDCDDDDGIKDPIEMFKVLDDTHQQYRSKLLKAIRKIRFKIFFNQKKLVHIKTFLALQLQTYHKGYLSECNISKFV